MLLVDRAPARTSERLWLEEREKSPSAPPDVQRRRCSGPWEHPPELGRRFLLSRNSAKASSANGPFVRARRNPIADQSPTDAQTLLSRFDIPSGGQPENGWCDARDT